MAGEEERRRGVAATALAGLGITTVCLRKEKSPPEEKVAMFVVRQAHPARAEEGDRKA